MNLQKYLQLIYKIKFTPISDKEWKKIDSSIKLQFKKKLEKIILNPRIPKNKLIGYKDINKIKLRSSGFRLAYSRSLCWF